jgi:hypothetical protein
VIKRQSSQFLRYEMFKRLNTGGARLSEQDIRNVNARMLGEEGAKFYEFIANCATSPAFARTTELLSSGAIEARAHEELVLRFLAAKNYRSHFKGNVGDWLDNYMESVLLSNVEFDFQGERVVFGRLFSCLADKFGPYPFVKYRNGSPLGGVAPAYFEAVTMGCLAAIDKVESLSPPAATNILAKTVSSDAFRDVTGPGANSLPKLERRISIVEEAFV